MKRMMAVLAVVCAGMLGACGRTSVTFSIGPQDGELHETTVLDDAGAQWDGPKVAMIDLRGVIVDGRTPGLFEGGPNPVDELVARLAKAEKDSHVRAVVLRVNSPGGSVTASDTMYREVRLFRERSGKPVVASMGEVAASGGYYVSLAADEILAQPTTITGSIGVIMPTINVSEGLKKIGVVSRSVKSGANKDLANPLEPMRESQYAVLQGMIDEFYGRFKGLVIERRGERSMAADLTAGEFDAGGTGRTRLNMSRIDELTDGRVVTGAEAVKAGLVDREGGLRDAFARAKSLAGLERARLVKYHPEGEPPRTPYAAAAGDPEAARAGAGGTEINLIRLDLGGGGGAAVLAGGNAYYLWTLGGL